MRAGASAGPFRARCPPFAVLGAADLIKVKVLATFKIEESRSSRHGAA